MTLQDSTNAAQIETPEHKTKSSVRSIARALLRDTDSVIEAAKQLQERAENDPDLYRELTTPYLPTACYEAVRQQSHETRRVAWTAPNYDPGQAGQRVVEHGRSLLDFPLPSGKALRHAKRADCMEAAAFYRRQAADMDHKRRWLERIAGLIGRKTVEAALSIEDLQRLQRETRGQQQ